mgnify:CR=1 FL=1
MKKSFIYTKRKYIQGGGFVDEKYACANGKFCRVYKTRNGNMPTNYIKGESIKATVEPAIYNMKSIPIIPKPSLNKIQGSGYNPQVVRDLAKHLGRKTGGIIRAF